MKKRLLIIPLLIILLLPLIIAPSYNYNPYDNLEYNFRYDNSNIKVETSRTFLIIEDDGRSHYRTFTSYNKEDKEYNFFRTDSNRKGIYRDLFDYGINFNIRDKQFYKHFQIEDTKDCPNGWICEKTATK